MYVFHVHLYLTGGAAAFYFSEIIHFQMKRTQIKVVSNAMIFF